MARKDEFDVSEDVGMFEAAVHAPHLELSRPEVKIVLVALDGSNQDSTARAVAQAVGERTEAAVVEHYGATSSAEILQVCAAREADLIVLPVPFGRDISQLKDESLGSVADMLLQESAIPLLCVREAMSPAQAAEALHALVLPVITADEFAARSAGWALRILAAGGRLRILAIADQEVIEEVHKLLGRAVDEAVLTPESLRQAVSVQDASLIAAVQKGGQSQRSSVHTEVKVGRAHQVVLEAANATPQLIVVGSAKDHTAPSFHRARDLILGAKGPVLIV